MSQLNFNNPIDDKTGNTDNLNPNPNLNTINILDDSTLIDPDSDESIDMEIVSFDENNEIQKAGSGNNYAMEITVSLIVVIILSFLAYFVYTKIASRKSPEGEEGDYEVGQRLNGWLRRGKKEKENKM